MAMSRVIDRDRGLKAFLRRFTEANGARVKVGVTESVGQEAKKTRGEKSADDLTIVLVAWFNEFGTKRKTKGGSEVEHVPSRSFIRSTSDEQAARIGRLKKRVIQQIINGKINVRRGLAVLGEFLQLKIQRKIRMLKEPPNAPSTKARKKSTNPLIDISQLLQSIRYEILMP